MDEDKVIITDIRDIFIDMTKAIVTKYSIDNFFDKHKKI